MTEYYNYTYEYIDDDDLDADGDIEIATDIVRRGCEDDFKRECIRRFPKHFKILKIEPNKDICETIRNDKVVKVKMMLPKTRGAGYNVYVPNKAYWENWKKQLQAVNDIIAEAKFKPIDTKFLYSLLKHLDPADKTYQDDLSQKQVNCVNEIIERYDVRTDYIEYYGNRYADNPIVR